VDSDRSQLRPFLLPRSRPLAMVSVIGRLSGGITFAQAQSNLSLITHSIDKEYPPQFVQSRDRRIELVPLHDLLVRNARPLLLILLATVSFVFLIACANVANLSFSRAAVRCREFAIRGALALGAHGLFASCLPKVSCWQLSGAGLVFSAASGLCGF
jgi:hypothetical protein